MHLLLEFEAWQRGTLRGWDYQGGTSPFPLFEDTSWLPKAAFPQGRGALGAGDTCCAAGTLLTSTLRCGTLPPLPKG